MEGKEGSVLDYILAKAAEEERPAHHCKHGHAPGEKHVCCGQHHSHQEEEDPLRQLAARLKPEE